MYTIPWEYKSSFLADLSLPLEFVNNHLPSIALERIVMVLFVHVQLSVQSLHLPGAGMNSLLFICKMAEDPGPKRSQRGSLQT